MRPASGRGLACVGFALLGLAACRRAPEAMIEPIIAPIEIKGPSCSEGGPSIEIVSASRRVCSKGDTCTHVNARVRNPESRALWLLLDADTPFSGYLDTILLMRPQDAPEAPVWVFYGQSVDKALKLPAGADVEIRNVIYQTPPDYPRDQLQLAFFDRLTLSRNRHIDWTDTRGALPTRGSFDLTHATGPIEMGDRQDLYRLEGKEGVSINVRCTQNLAIRITSPPSD